MALPTTAHGQVDENAVYWSGGYGAVVDALLDYIPDLTWPQSHRTYSRMRWDPQLKAVMSAYTLPIRRASWAVDGKGCRDEVTADVADNLGLPVLGAEDEPKGFRRRGVQWAAHLRLALLDLTFGYMPFSRWYDTSGPRARIAGVAERMPWTIEAIKLDGNGAIQYVEQGALGQTANRIQANELVWYANEREGSLWTGQSLLRPAYAAWLIKHELWRVHATSIRRFGMGIMQVDTPAGALPNQIAEAQRLASQYRGGDSAGIGLPAGFNARLVGLTGSVPDAVEFISYLDKQMTRATLTSLLDMSDTTHGSRALGETFMDLFLLSLQTIADEHAEQATAQLVVPLVDANFGEDEPSPRIVVGDVGSQHEVTAQTLQLLLASGALSADPALEEYVRREYKLPDRSTPWAPPVTHTPIADPTAAVPPSAESAANAPVAAAATEGFTSACIMAAVEPHDAARIAVPGGDAPESLHVTIGFLDKPAKAYDQATRDRLDAAVAKAYPGVIGADAFAVAAFNADNEPDDDQPPCTVLLVQSDALARLRDDVTEAIESAGGALSTEFPIWIPHVTLGYGIKPADVPSGRLGTILFDRLVVGWGDDQHDVSAGY